MDKFSFKRYFIVLLFVFKLFFSGSFASAQSSEIDARIARRDIVEPYINQFCSPYHFIEQYEVGNAIKVFGALSQNLALKGAGLMAAKMSLFYGAYDSICNVGTLVLAALDADIAWLEYYNISTILEESTSDMCFRMQSIPAERRSVSMPDWCEDRSPTVPVPGDVPCIYMKIRSDAPVSGAPIYEDQWLSRHLQPGGSVGADIPVTRELTQYVGNILVMRVNVRGGVLSNRVGWIPAGYLEMRNSDCAP